MKRILIILVFTALLNSCLGGSDAIDEIFFTSAKNVAPQFTSAIPANLKTIKKSSDWEGSTLWNVYRILQDYEYPRDEGVIDGLNIYKTLFDTTKYYEWARSNCADDPITLQAITPQFDLGNSVTYDYLCNYSTTGTPVSGGTYNYDRGNALKEEGLEEAAAATAAAAAASANEADSEVEIIDTGNERYFLVTYATLGESSETYGINQAYRDPKTFTVEVDMVYTVFYTNGDSYGVRSEISGIETTHAFTLRIYKYSGSAFSFAGKGISRGTGNYFLFKISNDTDDPSYVCFPAGATEETIQALEMTGYDNVSENCATYKEDVAAMTFFTAEDFAESKEDYNNGYMSLSASL